MGLLIIHKYTPPALLKPFDLETLPIDEFNQMIALALTCQKIEKNVLKEVFSEIKFL